MNLTFDIDASEQATHRGAWTIAGLLTLAVALVPAGLCLEQMPTFRVDPLDVLTAVITLQVLGAVLLAAWLLWSPA